MAQTKLEATEQLKGIVPVVDGGTGLATIPNNAVIKGSGTGTVTTVSPGTNANVLTDNGSDWLSSPLPNATATILGILKLAGDLAGTAAAPTIKSDVALSGNPTTTTQTAGDSSNKIATDAFVTGAIATAIAGVNPAVAVQAATTTILPNSPIYNNGASGVGATLTTATLNIPLVIDGYTPVLNDRVLIKNQGSAFQNGVYFMSQSASVGLAWILTRVLDYDMPSDINNTGAIPVTKGTANIDTSWVLTSQVTTIGTDALTYTQFTLNPSTILTNGLTSAHIFVGNGSNVATDTAMSGDATIANTGALTLASILTAGTAGDATHVPVINYDAKGRLTSVTSATITATTFKARIVVNESADGVTTLFTLPDNYIAGSLTVYLNGVAESHITETTTHSFTLASAPLTGWTVRASYVFDSVYTPPGGGPLGPSLGLSNL